MPGRVEKIPDTLMLFFNVGPPTLQLDVLVVGGRIGHRRERIRARPVSGGNQNPIEPVLQADCVGNHRAKADQRNLGRHEGTSLGSALTPTSDGGARTVSLMEFVQMQERGSLILPTCVKKFKD